VTFPDTDWTPVKSHPGWAPADRRSAADRKARSGRNRHLWRPEKPSPSRVLRGDGEHPAAGPPPQATGMRSELVAFADPSFRPVTVAEGLGRAPCRRPAIGLFGPARDADLDRVAFAVRGRRIQSRGPIPECGAPSGALRRDRCRFSAGRQRRMSAAATGFDLLENRMLGRGYLALMYRRYGNWPDADRGVQLGAGQHGCVDRRRGAPSASFPLEVERYRDRVLRDVGLDRAAAALLFGGQAGNSPAIPAPSTLNHGGALAISARQKREVVLLSRRCESAMLYER